MGPHALYLTTCLRLVSLSSGKPASRGFVASATEGAQGFLSSMVQRGRPSPQDAELERRVSLAARNLGEGVQRIVMAAKGKQSSTQWKSQLLKLLGGADDDPNIAGGDKDAEESDMDILLKSQRCENFVVRCLENELPPNMIHCLRLLRVLELQHATQWHNEQKEKKGDDNEEKTKLAPISSKATEKVCQLLCRLCVDVTVGEQLRPHLFGLLALSGASYPASGVHLARAASKVIIAFSDKCLSTSLVWFLHDRKMIVHMTDDIKELCGTPPSESTGGSQNNSASALGVYGSQAEEHGLWAISLSTVVHLVVNSCNHDCQELLKDFMSANGNEVLKNAILKSTSKHGKKLMELVPLLASCVVEMPDAARGSPRDHDRSNKLNGVDAISQKGQKLALNNDAFDIMEDIFFESLPLLKVYVEKNGRKPDISSNEPSVKELAAYAIEASMLGRFSDIANGDGRTQLTNRLDQQEKDFDLATDLLLACLQLYSDHPNNYTLLETHNHLLTYYLLAFPTFSDENLKVLVLKTVEFVVTGVTGSDIMKPLSVMVQVFSSICESLLLRSHGLEQESMEEETFTDGLLVDANMICETLEKLVQFDSRVSPLLSHGGVVSQMVVEIIGLLLQQRRQSNNSSSLSTFEDEGKTFSEPPLSTPVDKVCGVVCRALALIMAQQSKSNVSLLCPEPIDNETHHSVSSSVTSESRTANPGLNVLLVTAVKQWGDKAANSASRVFESIMSSRESLDHLRSDMEFCLRILDYFSDLMARMCGVRQTAARLSSKRMIKRTTSNSGSALTKMEKIKFTPKKSVSPQTIRRTLGLVIMLRNVLEASVLARDAFRISGGFDSLVRMLLCMGGIAEQGDQNDQIVPCLFQLLEGILAVVDAGIGTNVRDIDSGDMKLGTSLPVVISVDAVVDPVSTQQSPPSAAAQNRFYIRHKGFYLDLAMAMSRTMILENSDDAVRVMDLALSHMDPALSVSREETEKGAKIQLLRNPDAARLILGLVTLLPDDEEGQTLAKRAFDQVIRLCDPSRIGSTLSQLSSCGLCWSITNPNQFASLFDDTTHHLHTRFLLLLRRIATVGMSYSDFVSVLRCVAGPLLKDGGGDSRIRLPVISSSVRRRHNKRDGADMNSKDWQDRDADLCRRLEFLCNVAERGDRVPRCILGGDSINTISVLLHKTKVEDRLYKASEDGRLNFLEIDCIDSSCLEPGGFLSSGTAAPGSSSGGERIWTPLAGGGFSFSLWLRYPKLKDENKEGNIYILDISNPSASSSTPGAQSPAFFSTWYDVQNQRFNILSSSSYRGEPTCFPVSPLIPDVWHHVLLTYSPTKRTMMARKSSCMIYVDGRALEADVKIESIAFPPNSRVLIGAPNPAVAVSGVVRGMLPIWDLGPTLMLSNVLMDLDATSMFIFGPDFQGLFWGDRPQRLSLSATGSAAFSMVAETGEPGSVASALRRREIARLEAAGTVSRELGLGGASDEDNDSLGSLGLLCTVPPDNVIFAYRPSGMSDKLIRPFQVETAAGKKRSPLERLVNLARINGGNEVVSTDASVYGKAGIVHPKCFADNVQWAGGPELLMPVVNAADSSSHLALALRLMRASTNRHPPNLEAMQGGGGFQMLAVLLQGKDFVDESVLDQCMAFAVHGFSASSLDTGSSTLALPPDSDHWVFSDLDAMKQLLLNHQVWDLKNSGPSLPLRLLSFMNGLVGQRSIHKAFNSRRLHLVGIVRWTLHLMIESAELYTNGEMASRDKLRKRTASEDSSDLNEPVKVASTAALNNGWYAEAPHVEAVAVGGDPGNPVLQACKTLLRRILTFMLTPGDLEAIAEATMHTVSIGGFNAKASAMDRQRQGLSQGDENASSDLDKLLPGPVTRIYLLRLIEELIVDGVNEIVASADKKGEGDPSKSDPSIQPHAGGIANPNQAYLSTALLGGKTLDGAVLHPKHQQAQNFLSAFASVLTPVWFAALLEGCHEEATASAVLRLMVLMLQSSPAFVQVFESAGGFAPLVLSIPKFSTCSNIIISLLSQLLHVSILHLPCFSTLDAAQLNEVFDSEGDLSELMSKAAARRHAGRKRDPSCGIFALLAECMGRNIQLSPFDNVHGHKARQTNKAILELLTHRHELSPAFQEFCRTSDFLEPLAQALCLVHDERLQRLQQVNRSESNLPSDSLDIGKTTKRSSRRGSLVEVPEGVTPTERFIGKSDEDEATGLGMVQLIRLVLAHAVVSGPIAAPLVSALFRSFPIHATTEQVEAYQLVLIELCKTVVDDAIENGEPTSIVSCIGVCSVLLNRLLSGCFTSEPILSTASMSTKLLHCLSSSDSPVARTLGNADLAMVSADAAHIARLTCLGALRRSRPMNPLDPGDSDLQKEVLKLIAENIQPLMIVPSSGKRGSSCHPPPPTTSTAYPLWQSASLSRCSPSWAEFLYPDLSETEEPLRLFIVGLMVEIQLLLQDHRDGVRENAISIVVTLIQERRAIMSGILIKEVQQGDKVVSVDVMNRGGFSALLVAHEASMSSGGSSSKKNYAAFFDWFEKHKLDVETVFDGIQVDVKRLFPGLDMGAATPEEAVENEQRAMVLKLASQESSDRTIVGGLERAELAQRCIDRTAESHVHWKRQGFDDLAAGAMRWKFLLRRLKGSCSIWEGGISYEGRSLMQRYQQLYSGLDAKEGPSVVIGKGEEEEEKTPELVTRWKLDLCEASERQRRRLLPNYEFHSMYNVDETVDHDAALANTAENKEEVDFEQDYQAESFRKTLVGAGLEATAELLKELNIKTVHRDDKEDDEYFDDADDDAQTEATTISSSTANDSESLVKDSHNEGKKESNALDALDHEESGHDVDNASSYELITGLLEPGDWPEESYNVSRCTGLEVRKALLLWCRDAVYVIDGFEQAEGEGLEGKITRVEKEQSSYNVNLRPKDFKVHDEGAASSADDNKAEKDGNGDKPGKNTPSKKSAQEGSNEVTYQHRSQRIAFVDLYSVFRRRYQLQQIALEFYDIHNNGTLIAFSNHGDRELILSKVLSSNLPNSIFSSSFGASINYKKFMATQKAKIISQWVNGKMTNFELLMHLNSFAGRTYNDLTQYPVFPWVIADYDSEEIDLNDPKTFRDLSKPMGALGSERAQQFRDRYDALEANYFNEDEPPPFHYGTHYSCAAYVLYYLMRLEPFSRLALTLQGGRFDVADRLFHNVGSSWKSASEENLQDVRELIPEFFYLPDFLTNTNNFDFGTTQKGKTVHDVTLPKWAKGDPSRFIRINRQALESDYVTKNLHLWIDLIFGCKQRGPDAVKALNTFVHVTYEGEVDLDSMTDPVQRESTIAQIQNFGQTPSRLERRPFPQRLVYQSLKNENIDFGSLSYLAPLTPPFCVVGAPHRCQVKRLTSEACKLGITGQQSKAVGDLCLVKGQLIGVGQMCALNIPQKKYFRFGGPNNGLSVHVASPTPRLREVNKLVSMHDGLHRAEISVAKVSLDGQWLVTGCVDSTVRVWKIDNTKLKLCATLCGHRGSKITCLDVSTDYGAIVTGCARGTVLLWDLRTLTFVRKLRHSFKDENEAFTALLAHPASSVSINHKNGNVVTLIGSHLSVFDINGNLLGTESSLGAKPTCAVSTDCSEWMESGIVSVTGHVNGEVRFWTLDYDKKELTVQFLMVDMEHICEITALRVTGGERQDTLLVGDKNGKMSVCKTAQLEHMSQREVAEIVSELRAEQRQRSGTSDGSDGGDNNNKGSNNETSNNSGSADTSFAEDLASELTSKVRSLLE